MDASTRPPYLDKADPRSWKALNSLALATSQAAEAAGVERETLELMNVLISQLNRCSFCLDMHTRRALEAGTSIARLAQLPAWRDSAVFDENQRAALAIGEAATVLAESDDRRAELGMARRALGNEAFTAIEWAAVVMNAYNRVSVLSEHPVEDRPMSDSERSGTS